MFHNVKLSAVTASECDIGLTAYKIGALIDCGLSNSDSHIQSGLQYILPADHSLLESLDSYSLWLVANTLNLVDAAHPRLAAALDILKSCKTGVSGMRF